MNGLSLTTNSVSGNGVITDSGALASLTIGNGNTNAATNTTFAGNLRLVKTGTGSIQLANVGGSTNTGGAFLLGGTLRVGGGFLGTGSVDFNNATLDIAGSAPGPDYGVMNNALVSTSGTTNEYRVEQTPWTQNGTLSGSGTMLISLHPSAFPPVFWNANDSTFSGAIRFDTATTNPGSSGTETGFDFMTASAGSALASWQFTTDTQGFIAGWGGVGSATIQMGELTSVLGAGTAALRNNSDNTLVTYQIGALNTNTTFGGSFIDGGDNNSALTGLTKVGNGTLTLTGAGNSYRGPTNVTAGNLIVNNAFTGASPITVSGGTLIANASLGSGPLNVSGGNMIFNNVVAAPHPSASVTSGTLHFNGSTLLGTTTGSGLSLSGGTLDLIDQSINTLTVNSGNGVGLSVGGGANLNFEITNGGSSGTPSADEIAPWATSAQPSRAPQAAVS